MSWDANLTNLNYVLAELYPIKEDSYRVVDEAGLRRAFIAFRDRGIDNWNAILDEADKQHKVLGVIQAALKQYPDNPNLLRAEQGRLLSVTSGPVLGRELAWKGRQSLGELERLTGPQSTLLPVSWLELGLQRARSVARITLPDYSVGTGFLIAKNLIVTNNHVIPDREVARGAVVEFNVQQNLAGLDLAPAPFHLDPDAGFETSPLAADDWTAVRVQGDANAVWGALELNPVDAGKAGWVNIIQHPGGGPKQIAFYHNLVAYADDKRLQYLTDTLPGSSGSPVFDSEWRIVALHHSGGWLSEPGAQKPVLRNEGININVVRAGLEQSGLL